jgi:hypothetical protein
MEPNWFLSKAGSSLDLHFPTIHAHLSTYKACTCMYNIIEHITDDTKWIQMVYVMRCQTKHRISWYTMELSNIPRYPKRIYPNDAKCALNRQSNSCDVLWNSGHVYFPASQYIKIHNSYRKNQLHLIMQSWTLAKNVSVTIQGGTMTNISITELYRRNIMK